MMQWNETVVLWGMNNVPHLFVKPGILEFVEPWPASSLKCSESPRPALVSIHSSKAANMQNSCTLDSSLGETFHVQHAFLAWDVVTAFVSITVYPWYLASGGVSEAGVRAYWVWWSDEGWVFIGSLLQRDKVERRTRPNMPLSLY